MSGRRKQDLEDHDLIIQLDTKVDLLTKKVDDLVSNTVNRVDQIESVIAGWQQLKTERDKVIQDHENRLRFVEKYVWGAIAIIGLINLIGFGTILALFHR